MKTKREITYAKAVNEAIDQCLSKDKNVFIIGEGVPDPKGIFGTTLGLRDKYGKNRVLDMPVSENALTGVCIGAAIRGMKPIMTHQRIDFSLLAADQIINNAAKWYYMFGGKQNIPLVIRMLIGRGWGQGAQHSQSLQALYAHIPGLKVVMPATPYDAKGMLVASIYDGNPVIFIEHRWLHNISGIVPEKIFKSKLDNAQVIRKGKDVTLAACSYMVFESIKAADVLEKENIFVEVIDLRCVKPIDTQSIIRSVSKTGRLLVADTGHRVLGIGSEIISVVSEQAYNYYKTAPRKITLPNVPTPTSWKLTEDYYPTYIDIIKNIMEMLNIPKKRIENIISKNRPDESIRSDVPDKRFTGPF